MLSSEEPSTGRDIANTGRAMPSGVTPDKKYLSKMYLDYLREEGYVPHEDLESSLVYFKSEGRSYVIHVSEDDPIFLQLLFPSFWSIDSPEDRRKAETACVHATERTKVAKVYIQSNNVWAAVELLCSPPENFKSIFPRSMGVLSSAVQNFVNKMRELTESK